MCRNKKGAVPKLTRVIPFMLESFNKLLIILGGINGEIPFCLSFFACVTFELFLLSMEVSILCPVSLCSRGFLTHSWRFRTYGGVINVTEGLAVGMREPSALELISSKRVFPGKIWSGRKKWTLFVRCIHSERLLWSHFCPVSLLYYIWDISIDFFFSVLIYTYLLDSSIGII